MKKLIVLIDKTPILIFKIVKIFILLNTYSYPNIFKIVNLTIVKNHFKCFLSHKILF